MQRIEESPMRENPASAKGSEKVQGTVWDGAGRTQQPSASGNSSVCNG